MQVQMNFDEIRSMMDNVDENSKTIDAIVDDLVTECCSKLDEYVDYVKGLLSGVNYTLTNKQLDDIIVTVPTLCYYAGEQQEKLGIRYDVAKSAKMALYNQYYNEAEGTAAARKASAESHVFNEEMVTVIYERAHDTIKGKISQATEILQSAKKIVTRRMAESDITKIMSSKEKVS